MIYKLNTIISNSFAQWHFRKMYIRYKDLLRGEFDERFISPSGPVNWAPRLCDLSHLDWEAIILRGYAGAHAYIDEPASIDAMAAYKFWPWLRLNWSIRLALIPSDTVEAFIRQIPAEMLERVFRNWAKRMDQLRHSHGQNLYEIIIKPYHTLLIQIKMSLIFSEFYVFFF